MQIAKEEASCAAVQLLSASWKLLNMIDLAVPCLRNNVHMLLHKEVRRICLSSLPMAY